MANFIITDTLANAVITYLNTKPHGEVRRLIDELSQIKPVPTEKKIVEVVKEENSEGL
jgi:hypothetical protein